MIYPFSCSNGKVETWGTTEHINKQDASVLCNRLEN